MVGDRPGGDVKPLCDFRAAQCIEAVQQESFPRPRIGGRQASLDALDQFLHFGVLLRQASRIHTIDFLKRLTRENAPRKGGTTHAIDVHFLHHIHQKRDGITDRRFLLSLIAAESKKSLLNQVIDVSAARSSAPKQEAPQKAELILQLIARVLCSFNHPPNTSYFDQHGKEPSYELRRAYGPWVSDLIVRRIP